MSFEMRYGTVYVRGWTASAGCEPESLRGGERFTKERTTQEIFVGDEIQGQ
jgi:hypothetical protein